MKTYLIFIGLTLLTVTLQGQEKGTFIDKRDGHEYKWVKIGNQVWMAENLAYLPKVSPPEQGSETNPYFYVYGYNGTNVSEAKAHNNYKTYGVLYNWTAATISCPSGWHLPSEAEWTELTNYLGGESVAGGKLNETGTTHWTSPNTGATNRSGFSGLPGGFRTCLGDGFYLIGTNGNWWSATENLTEYAWYRLTYYDRTIVYRSYSYKEDGKSVRCVRD